MPQVPQPLEYVHGNGPILHVLPDQVADIFAGRGIHVFVACVLIYILSQRIGQLHVEAAARTVRNAFLRNARSPIPCVQAAKSPKRRIAP